jgi:hypothetical protein
MTIGAIVNGADRIRFMNWDRYFYPWEKIRLANLIARTMRRQNTIHFVTRANLREYYWNAYKNFNPPQRDFGEGIDEKPLQHHIQRHVD